MCSYSPEPDPEIFLVSGGLDFSPPGEGRSLHREKVPRKKEGKRRKEREREKKKERERERKKRKKEREQREKERNRKGRSEGRGRKRESPLKVLLDFVHIFLSLSSRERNFEEK